MLSSCNTCTAAITGGHYYSDLLLVLSKMVFVAAALVGEVLGSVVVAGFKVEVGVIVGEDSLSGISGTIISHNKSETITQPLTCG